MKVTIERDGGIYEISFKNGGEVDTPLKQIGTSKKTGTLVRFMPDDTILKRLIFRLLLYVRECKNLHF